MSSVQYRFGFEDQLTRTKICEKVHADLLKYSVRDQEFWDPHHMLRAFDYVERCWFKQWDALDSVLDKSVLQKLVEEIVTNALFIKPCYHLSQSQLFKLLTQQTLRMAGVARDIVKVDEKATVLKHIAGFGTVGYGNRFGTISRVKSIRMLQTGLGVRYRRNDIEAIVQHCMDTGVCVAPVIWEAILDSGEASIDQVGQILLDVAIQCDCVPTVAWLITAKGVDPLQLWNGQHALARAATHRRCFSVKWLVVNVDAFGQLWCAQEQEAVRSPSTGSVRDETAPTNLPLSLCKQGGCALAQLIESCATFLASPVAKKVERNDKCGLAYHCCEFLVNRCGDKIGNHLQHRCSNGKTVRQMLTEMGGDPKIEGSGSKCWRSLLEHIVERVPEDEGVYGRVQEILDNQRQSFQKELLQLNQSHGSDRNDLFARLPKMLSKHGADNGANMGPTPGSFNFDRRSLNFEPKS